MSKGETNQPLERNQPQERKKNTEEEPAHLTNVELVMFIINYRLWQIT